MNERNNYMTPSLLHSAHWKKWKWSKQQPDTYVCCDCEPRCKHPTSCRLRADTGSAQSGTVWAGTS